MSGLDNWITGHYGADRPDEREREFEEDEGALTLLSAMKYLKPRADADQDEQLTGEYEAYAELESALELIAREYQCHFCGDPLRRRKDKYCSRGCAVADHEGL